LGGPARSLSSRRHRSRDHGEYWALSPRRGDNPSRGCAAYINVNARKQFRYFQFYPLHKNGENIDLFVCFNCNSASTGGVLWPGQTTKRNAVLS
jgi:hypothetical protein